MRSLHISETTLSESQASKDIPMFCVKILYRECREVAMNIWFW